MSSGKWTLVLPRRRHYLGSIPAGDRSPNVIMSKNCLDQEEGRGIFGNNWSVVQIVKTKQLRMGPAEGGSSYVQLCWRERICCLGYYWNCWWNWKMGENYLKVSSRLVFLNFLVVQVLWKNVLAFNNYTLKCWGIKGLNICILLSEKCVYVHVQRAWWGPWGEMQNVVNLSKEFEGVLCRILATSLSI